MRSEAGDHPPSQPHLDPWESFSCIPGCAQACAPNCLSTLPRHHPSVVGIVLCDAGTKFSLHETLVAQGWAFKGVKIACYPGQAKDFFLTHTSCGPSAGIMLLAVMPCDVCILGMTLALSAISNAT